jgi:PAS domain S-box-containing protein
MTKEMKNKKIFLPLPVPLILVSSDEKISEANSEFLKISGFEEKEIIGKSIEEIFAKTDIELITKETLEQGFVKKKETTLYTKEKKRIPVSIFTKIIKKEKESSYFLGFFDLTEQKEIEAALLNMLEDKEEERTQALKKRERAMAIVTNFNDALFLFDNKNKLVLMNPRAEEISDVKNNNIIGKSVQELSSIPTFQPLADFLKEKKDKTIKKEIALEKNLISKATLTPLMIENESKGTLLILRDITREKFIERMKSEFVSLSAHQLRTPLSAIKWSLRMLLDGDIGKLAKEQKEFLERTYRSNERMINLINDLLDATRIEEGRYLYQPLYVDLAEIVDSVAASLKREIEKKNLKYEFNQPKEKLPKIRVDREKLELAIQNLLDNAIKYTPSGGKVTISLSCDKKKIEFKIQDTGMGIAKHQQGRVFSKFFRGSNALKTETEGSGLGLFITKNIIDAHGGRIWFESEEGRGSTFYFTLPLEGSKMI